MKLILESRYEPGETIYQLIAWTHKPVVRARVIESVNWAESNQLNIKYNLVPLHKRPSLYSIMDRISENAIYKTEDDALLMAKNKKANYREQRRANLERELSNAKREAIERVAEVQDENAQRIKDIERQLEDL